MLANSKKLANSCFHTSNTRQITKHANLQHGRQSAVTLTESCRLCLAFILCLMPEKEQKKVLEKGLDKTIQKQKSLPWRLPYARPRASYRSYRWLQKLFGIFIGCGHTNATQSRKIVHCVNNLKCRYTLIVWSLVRHFVRAGSH